MKRSGPPQRRTPLSRGTGPRRRELARSTADHPSGRRARFLAEFAASKKVVRARSHGRCEVDAVVDCTGRAEHTHHVIGRVHPRANEPEFLLDVCHVCHGWIHRNPAASYKAWWLAHYDEIPKENER